MLKKLSLSLTLAALAIGCGNGTVGDDGGGENPLIALHVTPANATVTIIDGLNGDLQFTATAEYEDGTTEDVTADAIFSIENAVLGNFAGARFSASGLAGGQSSVNALIEGASGQTSLTVRVTDSVVTEPAPMDAGSLFGSATEDAARAPTLVYPSDQTMVPPNLGDFDVHWLDAAGNDLFEVTLSGEYFDLRTYVMGTPNAGSWIAIAPELWSVAANSEGASNVTVSVKGLATATPETAGTSTSIAVQVMEQDVLGGVYYWASQSTDGPGGIYRHDMGAIGADAEQFYTTQESVGNRCVACHALSRDGTRMALTFDGGNGEGTVIDVGTRETQLPIGAGLAWNFATFEPGADRFLTVSAGALTLRDLTNAGAAVTTVPTAGYATHPDFRPQGDAIVYVQTPAPGQDWHFTGGAIVIQSFDPVSATFGDPIVLVESGAENNYYPSWSPDGNWILFNRSTQNAYDNSTAELYVVRADGSQPPIFLDSPNVGSGLTNSWARWAPFAQEDGGEPYYWFTFSSKRDFGVRLVGANRPQIWMTPFFPERAMAGQEASAPAFRLPSQDLTGSNHIAQWTEEVVPIE